MFEHKLNVSVDGYRYN